jgi:hypothetical protein
VPTFLPETFPPVESFPHERAFFSWLFFAFVCVTVLFAFLRWPKTFGLRGVAPWALAFGVILVETLFHTGLRSGYTLNAYYAYVPERRNWYVSYLFPNQLGAVSTDYKFFYALDRYFQGVPPLPDMFVLRRPYWHYIGSQLTYFFNPFHVYLVLNTLVWFAAVAATYGLVMRVTARKRLATFAAALVCCGNGFHYFVAQPKPYVAGYACAIIAVYAFDVLLLPRADATAAQRGYRALLCAVVLGLIGCVYDAQPLIYGLIPFAIFRRMNLLRVAPVVWIALKIASRWAWLEAEMLHIAPNEQNAGLAKTTIKNVKQLYEEPHKGQIYYLLSHSMSVIAQNLSYAFMIAAVVLCFLGLVVSERVRDRWLVVTLAAPVVALNLVLCFGGVHWERWAIAEFPRISYIGYPAIYVGVALLLERVAGKGASVTRLVAAWALLLALGVWQSADAFGYVSPSVHFYFPDQNPWLDPI